MGPLSLTFLYVLTSAFFPFPRSIHYFIPMVPTFLDWQISLIFLVFFTVFQYSETFFKYGTIFKGFHYYWLTNFLNFSSIFFNFPVHFFLIFPVFWVKFPDFSSLSKIPWLFPDWKMLSRFLPSFSLLFFHTYKKRNKWLCEVKYNVRPSVLLIPGAGASNKIITSIHVQTDKRIFLPWTWMFSPHLFYLLDYVTCQSEKNWPDKIKKIPVLTSSRIIVKNYYDHFVCKVWK